MATDRERQRADAVVARAVALLVSGRDSGRSQSDIRAVVRQWYLDYGRSLDLIDEVLDQFENATGVQWPVRWCETVLAKRVRGGARQVSAAKAQAEAEFRARLGTPPPPLPPPLPQSARERGRMILRAVVENIDSGRLSACRSPEELERLAGL